MIKFIGLAVSLATIAYVGFEVILRLANTIERFVGNSFSFLLVPLITLIAGFVILKFLDRLEKGEKQNMRKV